MNAVIALFRIMRAKAKPISKRSIKSVLGCVGEDSFERLREQHGWRRLRYVIMAARMVECHRRYVHELGDCDGLDHVDFPYLIELAIFDREDDGKGLKVYQCVNFMASMEDIFSRIFNINYRLGRVVLKWLNYGKSGLDE